jgi:hypothetical protein
MCPGRSAARSGALQNRDLQMREFVAVPDQRRTAEALRRIWDK